MEVNSVAGAEPAADQQESLIPEAGESELKALVEAAVYVTEDALSADQIAAALGQKAGRVALVLAQLVEEYDQPWHGLMIKEVAGGYKMATKPEHHDAIRLFVKNLKPPLKLSLAALETLAVIAYKQPITAPEVLEIRGVQGAGVLKTLLDRRLITTAGRKQVIGRPILYKTTKEFLLQFGLKDLSELPTLKEFEELRRLALTDEAVVETAGLALSDEAPVEPTGPALTDEAPVEAAGPAAAPEAPPPQETSE